jgi:hypothetical protein
MDISLLGNHRHIGFSISVALLTGGCTGTSSSSESLHQGWKGQHESGTAIENNEEGNNGMAQKKLYQSGGSSCWSSAFDMVGDGRKAQDGAPSSSSGVAACHAMDTTGRQELALRLTSCHMSIGGRPMDLDRIQNCTRREGGSASREATADVTSHTSTEQSNDRSASASISPPVASSASSCLTTLEFQIYTQFYASMQGNLCLQLYRQSLTRKLEEASSEGASSMSKLKSGLVDLHDQLSTLEEKQTQARERIKTAHGSQTKSQNSLSAMFQDLSNSLQAMSEVSCRKIKICNPLFLSSLYLSKVEHLNQLFSLPSAQLTSVK